MKQEQQIDQYLLGQLDEATARAVEQRAATDADFAAELQLHRDILLGIELAGEERTKAQIAAADRALAAQGFFDPAPPAGPSSAGAFLKKYGWAVFAVALFSVGAVLWLRRELPKPSLPPPSQLPTEPSAGKNVAENPASQPEVLPSPSGLPYPSVASPEKMPATPISASGPWLAMAQEAWSSPDYSGLRGGNEGTAAASSLSARAAVFFQKKDYVEAVALLKNVPPADPNYWLLSEMYAQACFLSGQTALAAERLRSIAASGQMPFAERAEWHLMLCCLADFPKGKAEFEQLVQRIGSDAGHPYTEAAKRLAELVK